ncbi:MJ1255/VC2487 family glycosyltransferase [Aliamphritea ceti]|uniref:MJ1255/VC2487 family glycosyltransferase n=1 Tax=Aliamphritea ceti TaxID=1524258 RepID=UPI0021C2E612|nr:MJ1255/VC2487 family glycosyltransferase [Aliamphritea ceti]
MKILYGVQATGNGHITRARVLAPKLAQQGIVVDYLFTGRPANKLFDMEPFGNYQVRRGLTFIVEQGQVNKLKTCFNNSLTELFRDIRQLDLSQYDLIISDFEPISAWAAWLQGKTCIGIAHQYAFNYDLPGPNIKYAMLPGTRLFAPASVPIGLHWNHFNAPILPPMINSQPVNKNLEADKILVYLPFESLDQIIKWLEPLNNYRFFVYCDIKQTKQIGHIKLCPFSREDFPADMQSSAGVIANSGFGLASEVLQSGKKLLTKPLTGQPEQRSNAAVLEHLQLADCFEDLTVEGFQAWLSKPAPQAIKYPDVATALAEWIAGNCQTPVESLCKQLWSEMEQTDL